jgi:hypothetical protein
VDGIGLGRVESSRKNESRAVVEPKGVREGEGESRKESAELWYVFSLIFELHFIITFFSLCSDLVNFGQL